MRKPKYFDTDSRHDRWLVSYVDIITILLILFAALAAQAVQRGQVAPPVAAAPKPAPAPAKPPAPEKKAPDGMTMAKEKLEKQGVELKIEERGLVISLPQAVLFAPGQDRVTEAALPVVAGIADVLRDLPNKILLVGHTDAKPIHSKRFHNNWELSAARSLRLLELLTERFDIPEDRLSTAGQGAVSPRSPNDTQSGRAANRRVEIIILNDDKAPQSTEKKLPDQPAGPPRSTARAPAPLPNAG